MANATDKHSGGMNDDFRFEIANLNARNGDVKHTGSVVSGKETGNVFADTVVYLKRIQNFMNLSDDTADVVRSTFAIKELLTMDLEKKFDHTTVLSIVYFHSNGDSWIDTPTIAGTSISSNGHFAFAAPLVMQCILDKDSSLKQAMVSQNATDIDGPGLKAKEWAEKFATVGNCYVVDAPQVLYAPKFNPADTGRMISSRSTPTCTLNLSAVYMESDNMRCCAQLHVAIENAFLLAKTYEPLGPGKRKLVLIWPTHVFQQLYHNHAEVGLLPRVFLQTLAKNLHRERNAGLEVELWRAPHESMVFAPNGDIVDVKEIFDIEDIVNSYVAGQFNTLPTSGLKTRKVESIAAAAKRAETYTFTVPPIKTNYPSLQHAGTLLVVPE
jgi:hypothetical protein